MDAKRELMTGNEALARGAYEAGVRVATGYPGTPSTEILENTAQYKPEMHSEWAPNEKVAMEVGIGASLAGARAIVTMKHVGLNVALDPLMTFAYMGAVGGLVVCVADDPGMHSSQNEQDSRHVARSAKIPLLEPADSQEAKDFLMAGLELSEQFQTPVLLRTTTRVSHSRGIVALGERTNPARPIGFVKEPPRFVAIPMWARVMRRKLEERLGRLVAAAETSPLNRIEARDPALGIITAGVTYQYVRDAFPDASVLKLGWPHPFPDALIRTFAASVRRVVVIEELDDFLEEHIRSLGIACEGRKFHAGIGELAPDRMQAVQAALEGLPAPAIPAHPEARDLPGRPPVLCPSCPHRGIFHALGHFDIVVAGDIGCYSLGVLPPLNRMDTVLCMGAGVSMPHGLEKAGEPRRVVGLVGDSTFFHSGVTGLLNIAHNRGISTIIVADNRTTAMTGHQDNPGTEVTLMGEPTGAASIEAIASACGIRRVFTVNPFDVKKLVAILKEELHTPEPSVIVARAACPLHEGKPKGPKRILDAAVCRQCGKCLKLGCPAIESHGKEVAINLLLCNGCGLCEQVCPFGAISSAREDA